MGRGVDGSGPLRLRTGIIRGSGFEGRSGTGSPLRGENRLPVSGLTGSGTGNRFRVTDGPQGPVGTIP